MFNNYAFQNLDVYATTSTNEKEGSKGSMFNYALQNLNIYATTSANEKKIARGAYCLLIC